MLPSLAIVPDRGSPIPLYHQIAEALRYRIATGAIKAGTALPPLREAAALWGVNLHTVRRAYTQLSAAGIVATRAPRGTLVLPDPESLRKGMDTRRAPTGHDPKDRRSREIFLRRILREAQERHGMAIGELIFLLEGWRPPDARPTAGPVFVAECSQSQAADLARQIEECWQVHAVPWPIDRPQPPRPNPIIATYFHYNDLRLRWPERFPEIRFLAIRPDPALKDRLRSPRRTLGGSNRRRISVILCEREEAMLRNIAADLSRLLPPEQFRLETRLVRRPATMLAGIAAQAPVVVAPRVWGDLPAALREHPRIHELRYLFDSRDLDAAGREFGWTRRTEEP